MSNNNSSGGFYGVLLLLTYLISLIFAANFSETRPVRTAETFGYSNVRVVSSTIWFTSFKGCGVSDSKVWYVEADNSSGEHVSFLVCGGLFRDNTIVVR